MDYAYEIYQKHYNNSESNYEGFLKEIQDRHNELGIKQDFKDSLHYIFGKLLDTIFQMFWMYHANNFHIYLANKKFYQSFSNLLSNNDELWIISLNHDLLVEFLCFDNNIPMSFGSLGHITFPESNDNFNNIITFMQIPRNDIKIDKLGFIRGKRGVNLIKLHGAINEFMYGDNKYILHIQPDINETPISYLNRTNKVLNEMSYSVNGIPPYVVGELVVCSMKGEANFLSKSLLIGGYKYSETFDPKPGEEKIRLMEEVLSYVDELTIIGYGFGDKHVNDRLYNAMLLNQKLSIWIIDPYRTKIPDALKPFDYGMRVRRAMCGASEWMTYIEKGEWDMAQSEDLKTMRLIRQYWDEEYRKRFLSL
jgi:hypothetical protein